MKKIVLEIWSFIWKLIIVAISSFIVLSIGYILLLFLAETGFLGMHYNWSFWGGATSDFKGLDYILFLLTIVFGFAISRLLYKKDLKETLKFWLKIIIIGVIVYILYFLGGFVKDTYTDYLYHKQITNFENNAEIIFELEENKVYVDMDNKKAYKVSRYGHKEGNIKQATLEEYVEKAINHDGIDKLYHKDNKMVYGVQHYGKYDFIFIILNENEYFIIESDEL